MLRLGIFAKTFARPSARACLEAVRSNGIEAVQFNLSVAGLASLPEAVPDGLPEGVAGDARDVGVEIAALSGTFNMAHPDPASRAEGLRRFEVVVSVSAALGTRVVTLCTGSRDPDDMWRRHPANGTPEAWQDMRSTMLDALTIAERHDVVLAMEPEISNVVDSPAAARRLLDEIASPHLRVVIDAANLFDADDPARSISRSDAVLTDAFEHLADTIVLAHAKDVTAAGAFAAAGRGDVHWERYLGLLADSGYDGPLVLHGLDEAEVPAGVAFLSAFSHVTV